MTDRSPNVVWQSGGADAATRVALFKHRPVTVWLTGLPGAGKTTLAFALEKALLAQEHAAYVLDGDNIRHGLCRDLGFSPDDRSENIRRIAEVARLMNDAGLIVIAAFVSPTAADRNMARSCIGSEHFIEVHVATPLAVCEQRDPKGMYKRARQGEIADYTGVSSPYEVPGAPALSLDTSRDSVSDSCAQILRLLETEIAAH